MPSRYYFRQFYPQTYHHIFNRGAYKQKIFLVGKDYQTFMDILKYYLLFPYGKSITRISEQKLKTEPEQLQPYRLLAYCQIPNHFHLLLHQVVEKPTIADLLKRLSITYAMYFQEKHHHSGALFQSKYKSVPVKSDSQLLYLSKYIHLNSVKSVGTVPTEKDKSSFGAYIGKTAVPKWLDTDFILQSFFPNSPNPQKRYQQFVLDYRDTDQEKIAPVKIED